MSAALQDFPQAQQLLLQADDLLGFPLSEMMAAGPEAQLNDTVNTQPALFVHALAAWRVLRSERPEIAPLFMAGHSLGELTALTAAGALPFAEGLRLVRLRGELMAAAGGQQGGMAAILGLPLDEVVSVCEAVGGVQVANDNCPGQVVISGEAESVARAEALSLERGARRAVRLAVSVAAHSALMRPAQEAFNRALQRQDFAPPRVPVIGNVSACPLTSPDEIRADLSAQLTSRVRWTESVAWMASQGVEAFVEVGAGKVLSGLVKRIARGRKVLTWRSLL